MNGGIVRKNIPGYCLISEKVYLLKLVCIYPSTKKPNGDKVRSVTCCAHDVYSLKRYSTVHGSPSVYPKSY